MDRKYKEELHKEFKKLKTDIKRWKWIIDNQDKDIIVQLDNDSTFAVFINDEDGEFVFHFDNYIGWSDGVFELLEAMKIKAESV